MKNIKCLLFGLLSFGLLNCSSEDDNGQVVFDGAPLLNFVNQGGEQQVFVISNTVSIIQDINIGTLLPVTGSHTVKLIPDLVNSTAVLGQDYAILNDTFVMENGQTNGSFKVEFFKEFAKQEGKKIFFTLESDLPKAVFNSRHTVNVNLACPVEALEGAFGSNTFWYGAYAEHTILQPLRFDPNTGDRLPSNQLIVKDFWFENMTPPTGNSTIAPRDFVLNFDKNYAITGLANTNTGRLNGGGQIRVFLTQNRPSSFNACTRTITLNLTFQYPAIPASGGNPAVPQVREDRTLVFTGIDLPTPEEPEVP